MCVCVIVCGACVLLFVQACAYARVHVVCVCECVCVCERETERMAEREGEEVTSALNTKRANVANNLTKKARWQTIIPASANPRTLYKRTLWATFSSTEGTEFGMASTTTSLHTSKHLTTKLNQIYMLHVPHLYRNSAKVHWPKWVRLCSKCSLSNMGISLCSVLKC